MTSAKPQITFGKFNNVDLRVARVLSAPLGDGTTHPTRVMQLDLGDLGEKVSVGQYALLDEIELVGRLVVACINLGSREIGWYTSEALVVGTLHPQNPAGQQQATPLWASEQATPGENVF